MYLKQLCVVVSSMFTLISFSQFDEALILNGTDDFVSINDAEALDLSNNFTVEAWVHPNQIFGNQMIFRKGWCFGDNQSYYLSILEDGRARWLWNSSGVCDVTPSYYETDEPINIGGCTHISVVHSDDMIKIYFDNVLVPGTLVDGSYGTVHNSPDELTIGTYKDFFGDYSHHFYGSIDEIRFWNYELSEEEIIAYSTTALSGTEDGLIAYYDMDDSGIGESLTLTNKAVISAIPAGTAVGTVTTPYFGDACGTELQITERDESLFAVYPNPTSGNLIIENSDQIRTIKLLDITGKLITTYEPENSINIEDLSPGIYLIQVHTASGVYTRQVVLSEE